MQVHKQWIIAGSLFAATAVAAGAFGAHGLKNIATDKTLATFETAVRYQLYHALALVLAGLLSAFTNSKLLTWAARLFIAGIILFSFSLYLLVFFQVQHNESMNWLGAITPLGGISFIGGWLSLAVAFIRK